MRASWYRMIGADIGDARKDGLVAARKARHEMRLDEAEDDPAVRLDVVAVQPHGLAVLAEPRRRERAGIVRVVVHDADRREHAAPTIAASSSGVLARCEPVPLMMTI